MPFTKFFLYFSSLALILITCTTFDDSNVLDYKGTNYIQKTGNLTLNPEGISAGSAIESAIEKYLGVRSIDDGTGRPITYVIWTSDTNHLAIKIDEQTLFGHPKALNIAILNIQQKSGWQEINRSVGNDSVKVSWWRDPDTLTIADFEDNCFSRINNCGGEIGAWNRWPNDPTQGAEIIDTLCAGYNGGNSKGIKYDVDSPNEALCGAYFKLHSDKVNGTKDLTNYKYLLFWVKGYGNFDENLQVEFKAPLSIKEAERFRFTDITDQWTKKEVLLENFFPLADPEYNTISDWSAIHEFVITFADTDLVVREGIIIIDDIILVDSDPYPGSNSK